MNYDLPSIIYSLVFAVVVLELAGAGLKKTKSVYAFLFLRTIICFTGIIYIGLLEKRPPLFGPFESSIYIIFIMGILSLVSGKIYERHAWFFGCNSLLILIILVSQTGKTMALNEDYFMYANIWVILFFNLRLMSAAFFAHGASIYMGMIFSKKQEDILMSGARNILLAGSCIYLASEWTGSVWCLNWFGDSWRWSNGFFKASIVFLLAMAVFHLPFGIFRTRTGKGLIGMLPGIFVLWMIFFH